MAKFKPGESGNIKGKPIGRKNKLPLPTKEFINEILLENRDAFRDSLQELRKKKPSDFCKYYLELVSFNTPKLRAVEVSGDMVSLLNEGQSKEICRDIAKEAIFKVFGNQISPELRKKYGN